MATGRSSLIYNLLLLLSIVSILDYQTYKIGPYDEDWKFSGHSFSFVNFIDDVQKTCLAKFDLAGQMLKLVWKCLVIGCCYHKPYKIITNHHILSCIVFAYPYFRAYCHTSDCYIRICWYCKSYWQSCSSICFKLLLFSVPA